MNGPVLQGRRAGALKLAACVLAICFVWGAVLPRLSSLDRMRSYCEWLDQEGIDPSAMYYTELEMMEPILQRLERPIPLDSNGM
ncbi:MAG: hypothetical protein AB8B91_09765 [Rubripirellula sp.]